MHGTWRWEDWEASQALMIALPVVVFENQSRWSTLYHASPRPQPAGCFASIQVHPTPKAQVSYSLHCAVLTNSDPQAQLRIMKGESAEDTHSLCEFGGFHVFFDCCVIISGSGTDGLWLIDAVVKVRLGRCEFMAGKGWDNVEREGRMGFGSCLVGWGGCPDVGGR